LTAAWAGGLVAIVAIGSLLWYGALAATNVRVTGDVHVVRFIPAAVIGLTPIGWYLWVTVVEPLHLR
jgi:hypothetical protein